jgi:hypothetical protein
MAAREVSASSLKFTARRTASRKEFAFQKHQAEASRQ